MESDDIDELKKICEDLWQEVRQKNLDVKNSREVIFVDNNELKVIHKENCRRIEAEINVLKRKQPESFFNSSYAQVEIIKEELKSSNSQLKNTLVVIRVEMKKMAEDILREEEVVKQLENVNERLQSDVEESHKNQINYTEERYLKDLLKKEKLLKKHQKQLMKTMLDRENPSRENDIPAHSVNGNVASKADFLCEHFPPPLPSDVTMPAKQRTRRQSMRSPPSMVHTLKFIIESLMNKCLETPHDAYLTLDDKFWQPYITLLIRSNIALFHPEDDKRIRLVPFHL